VMMLLVLIIPMIWYVIATNRTTRDAA
jgi:hypothetical protein